MKKIPCLSDREASAVIRRVCKKHGLDAELVNEVAAIVQSRAGEGRRFGINEDFEDALRRFAARKEPQA
jgi:hypothetical protein